MNLTRVTVAVTLLLSLSSCGSDSKKTVVTPDPTLGAHEALLGDQALAAGNYSVAHTHYLAALAADPNSVPANLGAGITEVYLVRADPGVDSLITSLGGLPNPAPARIHTQDDRGAHVRAGLLGVPNVRIDPISTGRMVARLFLLSGSDPVAASAYQNAIRNRLMPKLQYAEDRLAVVESHPTFTYQVSTGGAHPDTLEIDLGDVLALDAALNAVQAVLGVAVAYNFDVPSYQHVNAESLLTAGTLFGTLYADGAGQLSAARLNLLRAKNRLDLAVASINAEVDDQSDDVIPKAALTSNEFTDFMNRLNQAVTSLTSPVSVQIRDYQAAPLYVSVQIGAFFSDPIPDFKTMLPDHTFDNAGNPVPNNPITFPHPTFNGIFPDMTNALWQSIIGPVGPEPAS